jgi:glutamyl-tRNA reductase
MAKLTGVHLRAEGQSDHDRKPDALDRRTPRAPRRPRRPWRKLRGARPADIVVTATGATEPVLTRGRIEEVMRPRRRRPLFIIDIALPRDVEAGVGDLDQVFLYNLDDLRAIVKENLARRTAELQRADAIVNEEVARFATWMQSREIIPTVVALRRRFEAIRQSELSRLEPKLSGLPPEARARLDEITHLIVEKLLLTPTEQLKSVNDESMVVAYSDALNRLFSLADEKPAAKDRAPDSEVPS